MGNKFGALGAGSDDVVTWVNISMLTPAKKVFTSDTANEIYGGMKNAYDKVAFWKKENTPIYLLPENATPEPDFLKNESVMVVDEMYFPLDDHTPTSH